MAQGNKVSDHFISRIQRLTQLSQQDSNMVWSFFSFDDFFPKDLGNGIEGFRVTKSTGLLYDIETDPSKIYKLVTINSIICRDSSGLLFELDPKLVKVLNITI